VPLTGSERHRVAALAQPHRWRRGGDDGTSAAARSVFASDPRRTRATTQQRGAHRFAAFFFAGFFAAFGASVVASAVIIVGSAPEGPALRGFDAPVG